MTPVGRLWRAVNQRVGKVQQAVLLGLLATAITVPIAVAGPQGSANLQTTPTTTSSTATTTQPAVRITITLPNGTVISIDGGFTLIGTITVTFSGTSVVITVTPPGSLTLGATLAGCGLTDGVHAAIAETTAGQSLTGTLTVSGSCSSALAVAGGPVVFGPMQAVQQQTWQVSPNLQGVPLKELTIAGGVTSTAPSQAPAQAPAQTPRGVPGQIPAQLPHTGAGGGTL
jgi:hypothetical protein